MTNKRFRFRFSNSINNITIPNKNYINITTITTLSTTTF